MTNEPIRIAQMMTDMNFGGVEMVVMNYYRNIDRTKVQFDFIVLEGSTIPQREEIEALGGRIYIVPRYTHLIQYEKAIQKIFKENDYKIVHSHMNTLGIFSLYGAKKAGVPVRILHNHSTAGKGETKKNIIKYILRPFAKIYPTHLCACSKYAGEWVYGKNTEFKVFNNAIDLDKFKYNEVVRNELRKELDIEKKFVIGHIGRFCYQK
ncbi:glycosyltransferase, partial [Dubosiella newyorkensis]